MLSRITDLAVDFRSFGRPPRRLALGQLLLELKEQGVDLYLLDDIAGSIARNGFFFGHHNYRRFAVFVPVDDVRVPAGLLIVIREGSVQNLLSDTPINVTVVDADHEPARFDPSPPEVVSIDDFERIRSAVLAELVDASATESAQSRAMAEPTSRQSAS